MSQPRKLVLVFPPLMMPTSPPLGSAMLKGYIERELPDWRVKALDLNLWTFDRLFELLRSGQLVLDSRAFPEGPAASRALLHAADVFRGRRDSDDFYRRPRRYEALGDLFFRFITYYAGALTASCDVDDLSKPLPPLLQEMPRSDSR